MLDLTKPVQTKDGRKVKLNFCKTKFGKSVIAEVEGEDGAYYPIPSATLDLINVPEEDEQC